MGYSIIAGFTLSTGQLNVTVSPLAGLMAFGGGMGIYTLPEQVPRDQLLQLLTLYYWLIWGFFHSDDIVRRMSLHRSIPSALPLMCPLP